jgi:hypothetical protein
MPEEFQNAEYPLNNGFVDAIAELSAAKTEYTNGAISSGRR